MAIVDDLLAVAHFGMESLAVNVFIDSHIEITNWNLTNRMLMARINAIKCILTRKMRTEGIWDKSTFIF